MIELELIVNTRLRVITGLERFLLFFPLITHYVFLMIFGSGIYVRI